MMGLLLVLVATLFGEASASIGKDEIKKQKESVYTFGFLSLFFGWVFIVLFGLIKGSFIFSLDSLPTFSARVILEIFQITVTIFAVRVADRSTMGFLRIITIPLLLLVDIFIGYSIYPAQIFGMLLIVISLIILFMNHGIKKSGVALVVISAVNAVITTSLYKYDITNFNSVEAEQGLISFILMVYLFLMAFFVEKEDPIKFFKKPIFFTQSLLGGVSGAIISFAYMFAPASIIMTGKRASSILWSILSGSVYFHEKHFVLKILSFILILVGLILLVY